MASNTDQFYTRTENSKDDWETPWNFFKRLDEEFHFTLDPCASAFNYKCLRYFTEAQDGLARSWAGEKVFVNPPFKANAAWLKKCYVEGQQPNTIIVVIIPARTDTAYWHDYCMRAAEIRLVKGRVNFLKNGILPKNGATFPLAIIIFKQHQGMPRLGTYLNKIIKETKFLGAK